VTTAGVQFCSSDIRYRNRALEGYRVIFDGTAAQPLAESKEEYLVGEEKKKIEMEEKRKLEIEITPKQRRKKGSIFQNRNKSGTKWRTKLPIDLGYIANFQGWMD
jgi:hypothetical protein